MDASIRARFDRFVDSCRVGDDGFRLTPLAEPTAYARCFGVFTLWLTRRSDELNRCREPLVEALIADVSAVRTQRGDVPTDKAYRQLLAFTLSALAILGAEGDQRVGDLVGEQIPSDPGAALRELGCLNGKAQSGNQAMFLAIFLLHAKTHFGRDNERELQAWVDLHLEHMNRFGFWGSDQGPTHLHFQNGYHQYEIFEYLGVTNPLETAAVDAVRSLADQQGHFAPYPGGGGCYDYDAVFVLTPDGAVPDEETKRLLERAQNAVLSEQRADGGFCENLLVRPRFSHATNWVRRVAAAKNAALFKERLRYTLALQRPKHDRVVTHWSKYHRRWDEANLWDSYFRMLLLARIECAIDPSRCADWGFIDYPGIGWHPSLRTKPDSATSARAAPPEPGIV